MTKSTDVTKNRIEAGRRVIDVASQNARDAAQRIEGASDGGKALSAPRVESLIQAQVDMLTAANDGLEQAEETYLDALGQSDPGEVGRDDAARALERKLWHARGRIAEAFGPDMLRLYGLEEPPAASFHGLATYAHNTVTLLRASPQVLAGEFGDHLQTDAVADALEEPLHALDDYLATRDDAPRELRAALQERDRASDRWMNTWRSVSTTLEGLFLLADRPDLAIRVQPFLPGVAITHGDQDLDDEMLDELSESNFV